MYDLYEALNRAHQLDEAAGIDRTAIKVRIKEMINQVDWSRWSAMIEQHDALQPEIQKTKTLPNGLRVDVYLGWDYGSKLGYKEYEAQVARSKFDAFRAIVEKNEPSWSIKFAKSYGSRGVSWTNYWAQITVVDGAHELDEAAFSGGYAEGGSLDTAKRPGGSTKGSGTNFKALDGKKTRIVKAKDLKPGMITDTGKILKVTDIGWVNGKPSVEVSYGGIGNRGSYASDTVAADRDYEVLDEAYGYDGSGKPVRVKSWKNDFITNREIVWQHVSDDENCDIEELEEVGLYDPATDTLTIPKGTKLKYEGIDNFYIQRACYSMPDYNDAMIYINFDYWNYEFSSYVKAHKLN